jgi:amidophosphoribosyltransferase
MCGVVGVKLDQNASESSASGVLYGLEMLSKLQHRGQDGAGLSYLDPATQTFVTHKGLGLITTALREISVDDIQKKSFLAVAHTRYATTGTGGVAEIQPFVKGVPHLAIAHNGNIINTESLVKSHGIEKVTDSDLEVISQIFLKTWISTKSVRAAVQKLFDELNGSYSVVCALESGELIGWRDPWGLRPLFCAKFKGGVAFASETSSFSALPQGGLEIEEVPPSSVFIVEGQGQIQKIKLQSALNKKNQTRFCMFESVYFANPQSEFVSDEAKFQSVFRSRMRLGEFLAQEILALRAENFVYDTVVPVPETSRTAAIVVAEGLKIPYREFLVKNPYVSRTFILNTQEARLSTLKNKLNLVGPEVKGKNILLVDDSVVRGNTSRMMAQKLKEAGALKVGLASTCPPIRYGCFYGIDFPDAEELIASVNSDYASIAKSIGVDELFYLSQESLQKAIGSTNLCMACVDGHYPTRDSSFDTFLIKRKSERGTP